ncbi:Sodium/hydrogen exchanger [Fasciola hepatica]|uniref:Sodium/hydrogen exchanger n=1 Tax=Fasciola hepatica TaxID=6192 RepID=A0A4E0RML5_FASHE|nr:Sodium/hydrogen exchanger [Fasciola hepatica]
MDAYSCLVGELKVVEKQTEDRITLDHRRDSLILLVYVVLLVLSVITIWTFKHRRFRYFHETGLSVIYGLIVGIALRYGMKPNQPSVEFHDLPRLANNSCVSRLPPEKIVARMPVRDPVSNITFNMSFQYGFEQLSANDIPFNNKATFNPEIFFNVLLPPIIFTAGYSMKRRHFFENIGAILTYAFVGTFLSAVVIGMICYAFTRIISSLAQMLSFADCLLFGSIISATDPVTVLAIFNDLKVDVTLYALVFGESVLNDALAIALSQSVEQYGSVTAGGFDVQALLSAVSHFFVMFSGSFAIGVVVGMLTALMTKFTHVRDHPLLETTLFVLMSYSTFLLAETFGFTGIVAVLFCGFTQAHYTFNNLSEESKLWTKQFFELLNFLSENFVFAYIGVSTFTFQQHYWNVPFVFIALFACIVGRAVNVYPLSALINLCRGYGPMCHSRCVPRESTEPGRLRSSTSFDQPYSNTMTESPDVYQTEPDTSLTKITANFQHMLLFSGLRGAMAFSLAIRNTSSTKRQMFFSTTIVVVMITVLLCGSLIITLLNWLKIRTGVGVDQKDKENRPPSAEGSYRTKRGRSCFTYNWSRFDKYYLMPLLTHRGPPLTESMPWCCFPLAKLLTTNEQRCHALDEPNSQSTLRDAIIEANMTASPAVLFVHDKGDLNQDQTRLHLNKSALELPPQQLGSTSEMASALPGTIYRLDCPDITLANSVEKDAGLENKSSFRNTRLI